MSRTERCIHAIGFLLVFTIGASDQPAGFCARAAIAAPLYFTGIISDSQFESFALRAWFIETRM